VASDGVGETIVGRELVQAMGQVLVGPCEKAVDTIADELGDPAASHRNDGDAGAPRFQGGNAERLQCRGRDEHVGAGEQSLDVLAGKGAGHAHTAVKAVSTSRRSHLGPLSAIADEGGAPVQPWCQPRQLCQRIDHDERSLSSSQPAHDEDLERVGRRVFHAPGIRIDTVVQYADPLVRRHGGTKSCRSDLADGGEGNLFSGETRNAPGCADQARSIRQQ